MSPKENPKPKQQLQSKNNSPQQPANSRCDGELAVHNDLIIQIKTFVPFATNIFEKYPAKFEHGSERHGVFSRLVTLAEESFSKINSSALEEENTSLVAGDIGVLFFDRVRIRPIGDAVEKAPNYEVSLTPGEIVTLRQKTVTKTSQSESQSSKLETETVSSYSKNLSEEFTNEFGRSSSFTKQSGAGITAGYNQGVNASVSAEVSTGNASTTATNNAVHEVLNTVQNVQTKMNELTDIQFSFATENIYEAENVRVIRNDSDSIKDVYSYRMLQVFHLSLERYDCRLCWAPTVEKPGDSVKAQSGPNYDNSSSSRIKLREKIEKLPLPDKVLDQSPEARKTIRYDHVLKVSSSVWNFEGSDHYGTVELPLPPGYILDGAPFIEQIEGEPDDQKIFNTSVEEYMGNPGEALTKAWPEDAGVTVKVGYHLHTAHNTHFDFRIAMYAQPSPETRKRYTDIVDTWIEEMIDQELAKLLEEQKSDQDLLSNTAGTGDDGWAQSELTRQIIINHFPEAINNRPISSEIRQLFDWQNLSWTLCSPWWSEQAGKTGVDYPTTTVANASSAQVFLSIPRKKEPRAIAALVALGILPNNVEWHRELRHHIDEIAKQNEKYKAVTEYSDDDFEEISSPNGISLTGEDAKKWENDFERSTPFDVIFREIFAVPTGGIDFEERKASCPIATDTQSETEPGKTTLEQKLADAIEKTDLSNVSVNITVGK